MTKPLHPEVIRFLAAKGAKGGKVKSAKKSKAIAANLAKARAKRWAKK